MKTYTMFIKPDGTVQSLDGFPSGLGVSSVQRTRATHIWPADPLKLLCFRILRATFGDEGTVAKWTRSWRGPWLVCESTPPHRIMYSNNKYLACRRWERRKVKRWLKGDV